jgi:hypothetical protein
VVQPAQVRLDCIAPIAAQTVISSAITVDHRLKYSRPPELYLRHHAFLI